MRFADPNCYRESVRDVEDRLNGNTNAIAKSNFSMQLDPLEKRSHSGVHNHKMILVAGNAANKSKADHKNIIVSGSNAAVELRQVK